MNLILRLVATIACATGFMCQAQTGEQWDHAPKVVVVGPAADPRRVLVDESVSFWNRTLEELGASLRLPPVVHTVQAVPETALQSLSRAVFDGACQNDVIPPALRRLPGELTIVLGNSDFLSFASPFFESGSRRVIGIRPLDLPPMTLPNVARNVIAHELGHALGLRHNADPAMLMCGRPAACRPASFESEVPRVFPLTEYEKRLLRRMYSGRWSPAINASPRRSAPEKRKEPYRIGALWLGSCPDPSFNTMLQELRKLGYIEGENLLVSHRFGQALSKNAAELVGSKPDLVFAMGTPSATALRSQTTTLPVIFWTLVDPVEAGLVASLARPQGNLTGLTAVTREQSGKRLELLKAAVPQARRVGVLWNPADEFAAREFEVMKAAATALSVQLQSLEVRSPARIEGVLLAARRDGVDAVAVLASPFIVMNLRRIADLALQQRLPTIFWHGDFARFGGLMAYGPAQPEAPRQLATLVDKVLKGAKPSDLPVQRPTLFELVVNKATATALGITVPNVVLGQADEVIE